MFKISTEKELLECFREIDRGEVILSPDFAIPKEGGLLVKDYLTWVEPSLARVYLVFSERLGRPPLGLVFRRDQSAGSVPVMCEWCHSIRSGDSVGLLTVAATPRKRIGIHLCRDLSCKDKVSAAALVSPGEESPAEALAARARILRILQRMGEFARRELF